MRLDTRGSCLLFVCWVADMDCDAASPHRPGIVDAVAQELTRPELMHRLEAAASASAGDYTLMMKISVPLSVVLLGPVLQRHGFPPEMGTCLCPTACRVP